MNENTEIAILEAVYFPIGGLILALIVHNAPSKCAPMIIFLGLFVLTILDLAVSFGGLKLLNNKLQCKSLVKHIENHLTNKTIIENITNKKV